jgi:DNA polymerase-1
VNFGIIYGQSAFGLADNLGISRTEAKEIIESYFKEYPSVKQYMDQSILFAKQHGFVKTLKGRKIKLADINSSNQTVRGFAERVAINAPIQGSAADMIKLAMIRVHKALRQQNLQSRMILQVHDELVFEVPLEEVDRMRTLVTEEMASALALPGNVPVVAEAGTGRNWLDAH